MKNFAPLRPSTFLLRTFPVLPVGRDGFAHELAHGGVDLFGRFAVAAVLLVEHGLDGLEQRHVIANLRRLIAGGAEGKSSGKLGDDLVPAGLAVFLFEEVLLQRRQGEVRWTPKFGPGAKLWFEAAGYGA